MKQIEILTDEGGRPTTLTMRGVRAEIDYTPAGNVGKIRITGRRISNTDFLAIAIDIAKIVNVGKIGASLTHCEGASVAVPSSPGYTRVLEVRDCGLLVECYVWFATKVPPTDDIYYGLRLAADADVETYFVDPRYLADQTTFRTRGQAPWGAFIQGISGSGSTGQFSFTGIRVQMPLKFQKVFKVDAKQTTGAAVNTQAQIIYTKG